MASPRPQKQRRLSPDSAAAGPADCVSASGGDGGGGGGAVAAPTRLRMAAKYGLLDVPPAVLAASPVARALHNDEAAWRRYAAAREGDEDEDEDEVGEGDDYSGDDEGGERLLTRAVHSSLRKYLHKVGVGEPLRGALLRSVVQSFDAVWEDVDDLRSMNVSTQVWSPLALPTGVELSFHWHYRPREYEVEFNLSLDYRPLLLPGARDKRVRLLRSEFDEDQSAGYGDLDDHEWSGEEVSSARGVTRGAVRLFRTCLLGGAATGGGGEPADWPSAYALTSFVVRAGMAQCRYLGFTGHVWRPSEADRAAMHADGVLDAAAGYVDVSRSWIDHAIRRVTDAETAVDAYYSGCV